MMASPPEHCRYHLRESWSIKPEGGDGYAPQVNISSGARRLWKELAPLETTGLLWGRVLITPDARSYMYRYRQ